MRLPTWLRTKTTRRTSAGTVTVTLEVDTTAYDEAMRRTARRLEDLQWKNQLRAERTAARRWWGEHATAAYARYGWDWPGPVPGTAWARPSGIRLTGRTSLRWVTPKDPSRPTVAELEAGIDITGFLA